MNFVQRCIWKKDEKKTVFNPFLTIANVNEEPVELWLMSRQVLQLRQS